MAPASVASNVPAPLPASPVEAPRDPSGTATSSILATAPPVMVPPQAPAPADINAATPAPASADSDPPPPSTPTAVAEPQHTAPATEVPRQPEKVALPAPLAATNPAPPPPAPAADANTPPPSAPATVAELQQTAPAAINPAPPPPASAADTNAPPPSVAVAERQQTAPAAEVPGGPEKVALPAPPAVTDSARPPPTSAADTNAPPSSVPVAVAEPQQTAPTAEAPSEPEKVTLPAPPPPQHQLQLRITRDKEHCPKVACYKWQLVKHRSRPPRDARIDLAQLDLAPDLRAAVDQGKIDLLINATEHHKTVNGRDTVIFVATSLDGVARSSETP